LLIFYRVQIQLAGQPEMKKPKNILNASLKAHPIRAFSKNKSSKFPIVLRLIRLSDKPYLENFEACRTALTDNSPPP